MIFSSRLRANEKLRAHIWKQGARVERVLRIISILVALFVLGYLVFFYGFPQTPQTAHFQKTILLFGLSFFCVKYLIKFFYALHKTTYLKESRLEGFIILFLILGFSQSSPLFLQFCFLIFFGIEISKASSFLVKYKISAPVLMIGAFLILIGMGTLLLSLPQMTTHGISFIDALFTATSAGCVTGLTVLETSTAFTLKGQIVILGLVQLGGMSILSFTSFFVIFLSHSFAGLKYQSLMKDFLSSNKLSDTKVLFRQIFVFSITIEIIGAVLLYGYWSNSGDLTSKQSFFFAVFHSVSAFNNAGFSLFTENFHNSVVAHAYFPQTILMILIILGGLGFLCLRDFIDISFIKERKRYRWKKIQPNTKIAVYMTFVIIVVSSVILFFIEYNNSAFSEQKNIFERIFASVFQVVSCRTAGFNSVNLSLLGVPALLLMILIMFIGASPGSTGGGIKTTTFFVLLKSASATIKNKKQIEFDKRSIPFSIVDRAYAIVLFSVSIIFISIFVISIFEPEYLLSDIFFETVSAFSTAGASTGIIGDFGVTSKFILILNMFIGRIGPITIALALSRKVYYTKYSYANTFVMVG